LEIPLVFEALKTLPWLVPHLHAPIQSGSDRILSAMGRPYTAGRAAELSLELTGAIPDLNLGTDVMCGFPGETEADFRRTLDLIMAVPFGRLHVFPFSRRPGARAADLPEQVPEPVKRRRMIRLRELSAVKAAEFLARQTGRTRQALVEGPDAATGRPVALTDNYIRVLLPAGAPVRPGDMVEARIVGSNLSFVEAVLTKTSQTGTIPLESLSAVSTGASSPPGSRP
jgi:threonylcarbamoyladenosine tRNA methylthiotransferase MtaB